MNKHPAHTPHYSLFSTQRHPTPQIRHSRAHRAPPCGTAVCAVPSSGRRISGPRKRLFRIAGKAFPHHGKSSSAHQETPSRATGKPVPHRSAGFSHPPLHTFHYGKARSASSGTPPPDSRHSISGFPAVKFFYFHTAYLFISPRLPTLPATAIRQPPSPRLTAVTQPAGCTAVKRHASHRHLTTYPDVYTPTLLTTVRQFITFASHSGKIPCGGHSFTQDNAAGRNDGIPSYRLTRLVLRKETVMRRRPHTRCSTRRAPSHSRHGSRTPRPGTLKV